MSIPTYARPYRSPLSRWWIWAIVLVLLASMAGVWDQFLVPPKFEVEGISIEGTRLVASVITEKVLSESQVRDIGKKLRLRYLDNPDVGAKSLWLTFFKKGSTFGKGKPWATAHPRSGAVSAEDLEVDFEQDKPSS